MDSQNGIVCTALALLFAALPLTAGDASSTPDPAQEPVKKETGVETERGSETPVHEVVITAKREARDDKPYYVQRVIGADDFARENSSLTADALLKNEAGFELSRKGVSGADSSRLRVRGFDESRSLILLNGRNLNGAGVMGGYYVDWGALSREDLERIDVIRGAGPAKYGNTLGGVINIETAEGTKERKTIFRGSAGLLDTWDVSLAHRWGIGPLRYTVSAGHYETDGYLRNNYTKRTNVGGRLTFDLPLDLQFDIGGRYTFNKVGAIVYNRPDSPYYNRDKPTSLESQLGGPNLPFLDHGVGKWGPLDWGNGSYWEDERGQFDVMLSRKSKTIDFKLQAYLNEQDRNEFFYAIDDPDRLVLRRDTRPEKDNFGWRADFKQVAAGGGTHTIEYGAEGHYLGYGGIDVRFADPAYFSGRRLPVDTEGPGKVAIRHGGYVQDLWRLGDLADLELGVRFDRYVASGPEANAVKIVEDKWNPFAGFRLRPWEGGQINFRYRRANRFPTLPEYYWWYNGYQPPDRKSLCSEQADQFDMEVGHEEAGRWSILARAYHYDVRDYIRTVFGYRPSRVIYNIDQVKLTGVEAEFQYLLPYHFFVWSNYTWQISRKRGDMLDSSARLSDELVELPRHKANLGFGYREKNGLDARLTFRYVDVCQAVTGNPTIPGGSRLETLDPIHELDLHATYPVWRDSKDRELRFNCALENLLNQHYQEEYGYPMPGFRAMAGFSFKF